MTAYETIDAGGDRVRTLSDDDTETVVVDLGPAVTGTVSVRPDRVTVETATDRYELSVETAPERAYLNNGILTIEYGDQE